MHLVYAVPMKGNYLNTSKKKIRQAPNLTRILLSFLSITLLSFILGMAAFYLYYVTSNTISTYRRHMNAVAYDAQLFFDQREALLQSLVATTIRFTPNNVAKQKKNDKFDNDHMSIYELDKSPDRSSLGLIVTRNEINKFITHKADVLYTSKTSEKTTYLLPRSKNSPVLDEKTQRWLWLALSQHHWQATANSHLPLLWLNSPENDDRIFIFTLADSSDPSAGWLGITFANLTPYISSASFTQSVYFLVDASGVIASQTPLTPVNSIAAHCEINKFKEDTFDLAGEGLLPEYLQLKKSMGTAGWSLVYCVPLSVLVNQNMPIIQTTVIFTLVIILLVALIARYLQRRVLTPSSKQFTALAESETLNRLLVETAPVGLGLVRYHDSKVLLSNELMHAWIQNDPDWIQRLVQGGGIVKGQELQLRDNLIVQLSFTPASYHGEPAMLCVISDITALKTIEASLTEAKQEAEAANQAKTLFLTTMSHEIRTPLYGILGTLELFSANTPPKQQQEYLKTLKYSSSSLLRIVNDSLDLSVIEAGKLTLESIAFNPMELSERVVASYSARAESKNLKIYAICEPGLPLSVVGDETRVRQILDNLINNAIKFTDSGHVVLRVKAIQYLQDAVKLEFQVTDTGIGIAPENLSHLFEPYFRPKSLQPTPMRGSGLGLSICSRLTKIMNGKIDAFSIPDLGTRITVELTFAFSEKAETAYSPNLLPEVVYVEGAISEVVTNICEWLRHWGAQAYPYRMKDEGGILITAWPAPAQKASHSGKKIIALPTSSHIDTMDNDDTLIVTAYSVITIGRTLQAMQLESQKGSDTKVANPMSQLGLRLLIVDDNPINQEILKEQLRILGCETTIANNGREALEIIKKISFDAIFTDLNMPIMNGYTFANTLRAQGVDQPIIGLTGNTHPEEKSRSYASGITTLVRKPISLTQLHLILSNIQMTKSVSLC